MSQLVTITPKPGSRKFQVVGSGMTQFNKVTGSADPRAVQQTGEFKGQRFPNSRQVFKPKWSFTRRRWMLAGCEKNSDALNKIVRQCKLKHEKGDPRYPGYIESADVFDFDDPFFKHSKLKIIAREGEFVLDKDVPKDMILIMAIQANHQFALKGEQGGLVSNRVKYLITDKNIDKIEQENSRNKEIEATKLFSTLDDEKKVKIAMAMGLIMREDNSSATVNQLLWEAARNSKQRASNGLTMQDYFIRMCKATTDDVNVRYLIQKARGEGHLKKTQDGWMLFGQPVGISDAQVYEYFKNGENAKIIGRLNTVLQEDPIPAPKVRGEDLITLEPAEAKVQEPVAEKPAELDDILGGTEEE